MEQFTSSEEYYSVLSHEFAHSTGHKSRLNRLTESAAFGSNSYSKEELIAEISACMTLSIIGIDVQEIFDNSVSYIRGWSKKLREDKKFIVQASSGASKATNLILNIAESAGA
jgi:antirestriction protein ArdC